MVHPRCAHLQVLNERIYKSNTTNFNESSMYRMCRKTNSHDSLICVNFRILQEYVTEREN